MSKINSLKILSVSVLIMLILSLCYYNIQLRNTIRLSVDLLKNSSSRHVKDSIQNKILLNNVVQQLENSGIVLHDVTIEDVDNKTYKLKALIKGRSKLIFMFSELNCQTCIDMQLSGIEQLSKDIGSKNIILLASYKNKRDLFQFARINMIKTVIYNFNKSDIQIPITEANVPFFFIINPDLTSTCFFIPEKSLPKHTTTYLKIVKHRFFDHLNEGERKSQ
jgi:hypothetical protein